MGKALCLAWRPASVCLFCLLVLTRSAPCATVFSGLDDHAGNWGIFVDSSSHSACYSGPNNGHISGDDGLSLNFGIASPCGAFDAYAGIHAYQNLPFVNAVEFQLDLQWQYKSSPDKIQAVEFTMNKFTGLLRYEWALQWENIGDGTSTQGNPPTWRLWDGAHWIAFSYDQDLAADTWHSLTLAGEIQGSQIHYDFFRSDGTLFTLGQSYSPVSHSDPSKLAVAAQLDGDHQMHQQNLYLDGVKLSLDAQTIPEPSSLVTILLGTALMIPRVRARISTGS